VRWVILENPARPAKAGPKVMPRWIPAYAGMSGL
jgi:hypothetical protein